MKVTLNLAVSTPSERYVFAWAAPVGLLALAGSLFILFSAGRSLREYRQANRDRLKLQKQEAELTETEKGLRKELEQPRPREVLRAVRYINSLIAKKHVSLTGLTEKVAQLLPSSVQLTGMALSQEGGKLVVRFVVAGSSEEAVENFLINLEDSSDFQDVAIINQGFEETGGPGGSVRLTCTARYLGGG